MRRIPRLTMVGWMLATLAVTGFTIVALSYVVVFPEALPVAYLVLTFTTVVVGGVLCRPYLRIAGRGFTLGPAARHVGWWVPALVIAGFVAMWAVILSGAGDPRVTRHGPQPVATPCGTKNRSLRSPVRSG